MNFNVHFARPIVDPPRSRDCREGGHVTTAIRHRWWNRVHSQFSYFYFDGFSHFPLEPTVLYCKHCPALCCVMFMGVVGLIIRLDFRLSTEVHSCMIQLKFHRK